MAEKPKSDQEVKETSEVAKETNTTYEKASRAREEAVKDIAKEGWFKPGKPSEDKPGKA